MRPLPFVWPWALAYWAAFLWAFTIEGRVISRGLKDERANREQDAGSMYVVMLTGNLSSLLAFLAAFRWHQFDMSHRMLALWCGIALMIAGSMLRRHCFRMLGASFTGVVQVRPEQVVVDRGAYRLVRHPSYSAGLLMFAGVGVGLGNWASVVLNVGISFLAYWYRVRVEERAMLTTIGEPYRAYMARTRRFIPFLF
jgi:protein-S-isoprenylcysteine O-methyltransferase Ste14